MEVVPSGAKRWRLRYFHLGKEKMLSLGKFPAVSPPGIAVAVRVPGLWDRGSYS